MHIHSFTVDPCFPFTVQRRSFLRQKTHRRADAIQFHFPAEQENKERADVFFRLCCSTFQVGRRR